MIKEAFHIFVISFILGIGALSGGILSNNTAKANNISVQNDCDGTTCENDMVRGFRCFSGVNDNYTCDDSGYPDCSETYCGGNVE